MRDSYSMNSDTLKLPVCRNLAYKNKNYLSQGRFIILQHLLPDTLEFVTHLQNCGATIDTILGKDYSVDQDVVTVLQKKNIPVEIIHYTDKTIPLKQKLFPLVVKALQKAKQHNQTVIIQEIGGNFHDVLADIPPDLLPYFGGIIEGTTFGLNRYQETIEALLVPVFHIAQSELKAIEASYVGEMIVFAFLNLMNALDEFLQGKDILVIGYGMIGKHIAHCLRNNKFHVTVLDKDPIRLLQAFSDGYKVLPEKKNLNKYAAIFSATGTTALRLDDLKKVKNNVVLISGGSQNIEFDIATLQKEAVKIITLHPEIKAYTINRKQIILLREGTPINFREKSIASTVMDLVFSEILSAMVLLMKKDIHYAPGIYQVPRPLLQQIAQKWLTYQMS